VAQERRQGWPVRLLKIIRNPLVILLATLSAVSFATGDARAGTVLPSRALVAGVGRWLRLLRGFGRFVALLVGGGGRNRAACSSHSGSHSDLR
jgi:hypothetical protein